MKVFTSIFVLIALATSQAIAVPTAEAADLETRAKFCVDIKVCHGYNYEGGCYSECNRPGTGYGIRKEYRKNAGSFKIETKGYNCQVGSSDQGTQSVNYPGVKRLKDGWINNIEGYQCNKLK
ncbi:hypothetical protein LT330_004056 [Penicillium expansum]|uniref:Uncharacterized protein n=1 Tax=Penicillium expansum TaxID=27334 RepID=A0A0A2K3X6_PENEN|nr:hypothetical protein PEX2_016460 [Penicillium expansum]KAJ5498752.1 hypothetical protein N7453_007803 [Penicillium expansum]KAK4861140.1 hypothetical protein LT330_004056 [Penicillium expansum]KGO38157.1 hypothetical protein PEXP_101150 [Penicillium expansum]KGO51247.1 hypothetical protein PEX1_002270 [Penicillium expansum]KGO61741.1 hypothetical protein PEX2_016460 [Penicillium expansum]